MREVHEKAGDTYCNSFTRPANQASRRPAPVAGTGIFGADMTDHPDLSGHDIELPEGVLADAQSPCRRLGKTCWSHSGALMSGVRDRLGLVRCCLGQHLALCCVSIDSLSSRLLQHQRYHRARLANLRLSQRRMY